MLKKGQIMKSTGIVRKLDQLGRITLPAEARKILDIDTKDPIEIFLDKDTIVLKKFSDSCVFCSEQDDFVPFNGKSICRKCLKALKNTSPD